MNLKKENLSTRPRKRCLRKRYEINLIATSDVTNKKDTILFVLMNFPVYLTRKNYGQARKNCLKSPNLSPQSGTLGKQIHK